MVPFVLEEVVGEGVYSTSELDRLVGAIRPYLRLANKGVPWSAAGRTDVMMALLTVWPGLASAPDDGYATIYNLVSQRVAHLYGNLRGGSEPVTSLGYLGEVIHRIAHEKGFYSSPACIADRGCHHLSEPSPDSIVGRSMLVTTDISVAVEAERQGLTAMVWEELADALIRILDICAAKNIRISDIVEWKIEINRRRPLKHGGKAY